MIADSLWLLLYLAAIFLVGHVVVSVILRGERRPSPECVGLVLAIGTGALGLILFWASLAGFRPSRSFLAVIVLVFGAKQFQLFRNHQWPWAIDARSTARSRLERLWMIASIAVIAACVVMVSLHAVALPVYEWDSFAIWAFKAKVVARESLLSRPQYFYDTSLSYSHLDYPLLVPFLMAGAYGAIGSINEHLGKVIFPMLYVAFGFQIFSALRWKMGRSESLLLTALAMSIPVLVRWAGAGVADVVLVLYYTGAVFHFLKWMEEERKADLVLSILLSAFAAFTKNEGFALGLIIGGIMLLFSALARSKAKMAGFVAFAAGLLVLHLPWLWWSRAIPHTHENYGARLRPSVVIENWDRLSVVFAEFLTQAWMWSRWGGVWLLLLLVTILGRRGLSSRYIVVLWLLLVAQLSLYALIFVVTPWNVQELVNSALDRLFLQTLPLVVLLFGYHWREIDSQTATL